jgi:hypothetical protein
VTDGGDSGNRIFVLYWRRPLIRVSVIRGSTVFLVLGGIYLLLFRGIFIVDISCLIPECCGLFLLCSMLDRIGKLVPVLATKHMVKKRFNSAPSNFSFAPRLP